MRIAVPVADGTLATHFGHCTTFSLFDIDRGTTVTTSQHEATPPPHEPGVLPGWLAGLGVNVVIAAGIGSRARNLLAQHDVTVISGVVSGSPEELVRQYLAGRLSAGDNMCDH